jgi:hypothetical protein
MGVLHNTQNKYHIMVILSYKKALMVAVAAGAVSARQDER